MKVILLDEPTRGIDVGAKHEIYNVIYALAAQGVAVLFASSDLPEVLGVADRIVVMREGEIAGELLHEQADERQALSLAMPKVSQDVYKRQGMLQKSLIINQPNNTCCRVNFAHMSLASNCAPVSYTHLQEVVSAIRSVYSGQRYIASDIAQQMALSQIEPEKTESPFASLSERELQIMLMITKGQKVNEISEQLNLSPKTVNSYRYRMSVSYTHLILDGKFSSNGMTSLPWQWAAINYVSWNFSRQMLCVKVPIR